MKVDIQSLGTFNRLAHEGAEQATRSMCQMTGLDAAVDVTKITLVGREDVGDQLAGDEYVEAVVLDCGRGSPEDVRPLLVCDPVVVTRC